MDSDLSHEALDRFEAVEARLDALEGASAGRSEEEEVIVDEVDTEGADE